MAHFSEHFLQQVLERSDIVELISRHVDLKKAGGNLMGLCPFHHEKTPSFSVSPDKQLYHCFGCGKGGGAFQFLMDYDDLAFPEAVERLAEKAGLDVPRNTIAPERLRKDESSRNLLSKTVDLFHQELYSSNSARARHYLQARSLPEKIWQDYLLGYAPEGYGFLQSSFDHSYLTDLEAIGLLFKGERGYGDRFRGRIMFPIRDRRGRFAGFGGRLIDKGEPKYLNSPETALFHKSEFLYGYHENREHIRKLGHLLVVEGYMDVLMLAAFDLPFAVAPLGTAIGESQIKAILRLHPSPVFCFDGDRAGRRASWRALECMMPVITADYSPRFMFLPEGEDPDSLLRHEGRQGFTEQMEKAAPVLETFLAGLKNLAGSGAGGRAQMAKRADRMLREMGDHYLRQAWQQDVERVTGISLKTKRFMTSIHSTSAGKAGRKRRSLEDQFVAVLLQNPERFEQLPKDADQFSLDDKVLNSIYTRALQHIRDGSGLSPSRLALDFPDDQRISRWLNEPEVNEETFTGLLLDIRVRDVKKRLGRTIDLSEKGQLKNCLRQLEQERIELYKRVTTEVKHE